MTLNVSSYKFVDSSVRWSRACTHETASKIRPPTVQRPGHRAQQRVGEVEAGCGCVRDSSCQQRHFSPSFRTAVLLRLCGSVRNRWSLHCAGHASSRQKQLGRDSEQRVGRNVINSSVCAIATSCSTRLRYAVQAMRVRVRGDSSKTKISSSPLMLYICACCPGAIAPRIVVFHPGCFFPYPSALAMRFAGRLVSVASSSDEYGRSGLPSLVAPKRIGALLPVVDFTGERVGTGE